MKKVLIITYYWPPSGGGGVQRWLKMQMYLADFGWEPVIFTPSNPEIGAEDHALTSDIRSETKVIKLPIWEPYTWYKKFTGKDQDTKVYNGFMNEGNKKESVTQKMSKFIRGNFFIPDARKFWIKPASNYLIQFLKEEQFDAIISTGPPHSMHMIAMKVAAHHKIPWIADFRDPWTRIDIYDKLSLTPIADWYHHYLEKKVLSNADHVVAVTWAMGDEFREICPSAQVSVITNGFDEADFQNNEKVHHSRFVISYLGSMNADRNPSDLWKAIQQIKENHFDLYPYIDLQLIGQIDAEVIQSVKEYQLDEVVTFRSFIPHNEAITSMVSSDLLLIIINKSINQSGILPGKMYEYIGSGNPILCIGPKGSDAEKLMNSIDSNYFSPYDSVDIILERLLFYLQTFKNNTAMTDRVGDQHLKYSRRLLARDYAQLLNQVVDKS